MPAAEAHVRSERASRYILQLCRHAQKVQRLRERGRALHDGGDAQRPPEIEHVEWSVDRGMVSFGWGRCTMRAVPSTLTLRAEATDDARLRWVQDVVARNIERFGRREDVSVDWRRPAAPIAQAASVDSPDAARSPEGAQRGVVRRADRRTMALASAGAVGVVLMVAAHVGLGGALVAAPRWLGWPAIAVVIVPAVAILGHALVPVAAIGLRRRAARRSRASTGTDEK